MADKKEKVELEIKDEKPEMLESDKKALESFSEVLKDNNKKISSLEKEIKSAVDRIDSFEFDTDAELTKQEPEPKEKKGKGSLFIILGILAILVAWAFKDKIKNGIQQKEKIN